MDEGWVKVFVTIDPIEAEFIKGLLESGHIPVVMEARGLKSMDYLFGQAANGELILKVPPDLADLARELLAAPPEPDAPES